MRRSALLGPVVLAAALLAPPSAIAAVSVDRASLTSGSLVVDGRGAQRNATVTATSPESTASARADRSGRFRLRASGYRSSTCSATVSDGSSSTTVTLAGCTVSSAPPPPPPPTDPAPPPPPP